MIVSFGAISEGFNHDFPKNSGDYDAEATINVIQDEPRLSTWFCAKGACAPKQVWALAKCFCKLYVL